MSKPKSNNQPQEPTPETVQQASTPPEPLTTENFLVLAAEVLMPLLERIENLEQKLEESQKEQTRKLKQQQETFLKDLTQLLNSRKSSELQKQLAVLIETLNKTSDRIEQQVASDEQLSTSIEKLQHTLDNRKLEIY